MLKRTLSSSPGTRSAGLAVALGVAAAVALPAPDSAAAEGLGWAANPPNGFIAPPLHPRGVKPAFHTLCLS